jgi:hypothetical protein
MHRPVTPCACPSGRRPAFAGPQYVLVACAFAALGCDRKDDAASVAPQASALVATKADPAAASWRFSIDGKSTTHVDMPGLKEHIQADTTAATGWIDVVPGDLGRSTGLIRVDLSTFATHTFGSEKDATQTEHARTWLEVVVDGKTNEDMRWAEYAVRSIDGLTATALPSVAPSKTGGDDVRTVTMTLHGDLRIHGHKVQKDQVVEVSFRYPGGAPADAKPARVQIRSKEPLHVVLKEFEVAPRDPGGKALAWTTSLLSKVAETADVTFDLGAVP